MLLNIVEISIALALGISYPIRLVARIALRFFIAFWLAMFFRAFPVLAMFLILLSALRPVRG